MKRMSFALTVHQAVAQVKTVTRRDPETWKGLKAGDVLQQVEKGMGLKKGEKAKPIHQIRILSVELEPLEEITPQDVALEGFPHMAPSQFVAMYRGHHKNQDVAKRIEFGYETRYGRIDTCVICSKAIGWITNAPGTPDTRGGMPFPSALRCDPWPWDQAGHGGEGPRVCNECHARLMGYPGTKPLVLMKDGEVYTTDDRGVMSSRKALIPRLTPREFEDLYLNRPAPLR